MCAVDQIKAASVCRHLLSSDRANNLLEKWTKAYSDKGEDEFAVLVIASVIAAGTQEPSATTSLSVAQGLVHTQVGQMLFFVGLAFEVLENKAVAGLSNRDLIEEGLNHTFKKFTTKISKIKE